MGFGMTFATQEGGEWDYKWPSQYRRKESGIRNGLSNTGGRGAGFRMAFAIQEEGEQVLE